MYEINSAAVIGAGTMGLGIAGQLANAGVDVLLLDLPAPDKRNAIGERAIERLLDERQPGLLHRDNLQHISIGNIEDDLGKLGGVDWIAEAVVERLDVKQALYRKIDEVRKPRSIVSSNTSTIPISLLVNAMPARFRSEFAITHFFNPVRYMQLLELVRGEDTSAEVMHCLARFNDERMGKGVVMCRDTPGFLGNRVGVFALQAALHLARRHDLSPEEADAIFGRPLGMPKTGVFGLYDLIGIDLMSDVARNLADMLPASDAFQEFAAELPVMKRMIEAGRIGNKGNHGGFYRRTAAGRETLDLVEFAYRASKECKPGIAVEAEAAGDFTRLLQSGDKYGRYAWDVLSRTLCYAAGLVPEVTESPVAIDDAMKLGYNWTRGPFEMLDAIGTDRFVARLGKDGRHAPPFLASAAGNSFYRAGSDALRCRRPDGAYGKIERPPGVIRFSEMRRTRKAHFKNEAASYYLLDGGAGLVEFHSKANTLDGHSMRLLQEAVVHATASCPMLILHNDAQHFSCGVNLQSVLDFIERQDFDGLDRFLDHFQQTVLSLRDAPIPVIAAPSGLSIGGGFEVILHTDLAVFHANSVTGLVETRVGLVPGGGGVKEMLYRWSERTGDVGKGAWQAFMNIGYGRTARSPLEALDLAMFRAGTDRFEMNRDRLLSAAMRAGDDMANGYVRPARAPLAMPGRPLWQDMQAWLETARSGAQLTPHDVTTAGELAMILTGGDVDPGTPMTEQDLLDLERRAFVELARTRETRARILHMLAHGSPLRN